MTTYTTISGDTWDKIAKKVYGDDHAFEKIMEQNGDYIDVLIFGAGIKLSIPDETETSSESVETDQALWREDMN